ncbi:ribonuclease Z, partial [Acinetobacter baumannii]|nr:ribonuclease Z [Acinetobacter baumannii]
FRTLQLPALGLYHCEDASLSALKQACQPWPGLFVSRDGLTLTLPRPTPTDETYLL